MKLQLRYFASLREALGPGGELEWPADVALPATAGALRDWLARQSEAHARVLASQRLVRVAVDQVMAGPTTPLREGAEVAFFPPVTGG